MNTCANCTATATFVYSLSNTNNTFFCGKHAPRSVRNLLVALSTSEDLAKEVATVSKASKKSKSSAVINSTPIEEVVDSNSNENEPTEEEVTDNEPNE